MPAIGVLKATLADDAEGTAIAFGHVSGFDTSSFTAGDSVYVNASGGFTTTKPTGTKFIQKIGIVVKSHASNGSIKVFGANRTNDVPTPLYIDHSNQRLGIGTTTPGYKLEVDGSAAVDSLTINGTDVTATATEINILDGIPSTLTATELGYVDGVTSSIQTQLDNKISNVTTNLSATANGTSLTVNSSDGNNASIPAATTSAWGAMTDEDKVKLDGLAANANNYTHPTFNGDDFSIDTGALTGAVVISDLDINVTTNANGHVTDANGTVATRTLTLGDLGYTGATNANYITNNNQLANGAGYITSFTNDDVSVANLKTRLAGGFGSNAVQIGDSTDTVTIPGDLVVTGTTTTNNVETVSTTNGVVFEGNAADANEITLLAGTVTADRTITLPDAAGTVALTSDLATVGDGGLTQKNFTTTLFNKLNGIAASANNYTHPTFAGDDINIDTGALTGATVISDLDLNVTTNSDGHVTDANAAVSTRNLTLADLGYTGATNATANTGTVDTSGTPVDNDFAKFTDANTIEGRSASETRSDLGLGSLATLSTVNASTITDNSVGAAELNVSGNGSTSQFLRSDGDGTFTWTTPTNTNTNQLTTFQVEDGDGTEVTISHGKEWKFSEGQGIDVNWTDTSNGTDLDPYDLTFALKTNGVRANELLVSGNGTSSQFLRSDGDGSFTWATPTDTNTTYSTSTAYGTTISGTQIRLNGGEIAGGVDLNTMRTQGVFSQNSNNDAVSGSNYPEQKAGVLTVDDDMFGNGYHTHQMYSIYNSQNIYSRSYYNGSWTSWRNLAQDTNTQLSNAQVVSALSNQNVDLGTGSLTATNITLGQYLYHDGDTNTYLQFNGADNFRVVTDGWERFGVSNSGIVINDVGRDYDFRVESNDNANMLFVDGWNDRVGIGTNTPSVSLDINATDAIALPTGTTAQRPSSPAAGMFRYNTTDDQFEGYTTEWGAIAGSGGGGSAALNTSNNLAGDGSTVVFALGGTPGSANDVIVFLNGVYQEKSNYSISGSNITFTTAPPNGYSIEVKYVTGALDLTNVGEVTLSEYVGDGNTSTYALGTTPTGDAYVDAYIDGVYQEKGTYSVAGSNIVFDSNIPNGSSIELKTIGTIPASSVTQTTFVSDEFTANGSTNNFTLVNGTPTSKSLTMVFIQGVYQSKSNYNLVSGEIQLTGTPDEDDVIEVISMSAVNTAALPVTSVNGSAGAVVLDAEDIPGVVDTSDDTTGLTFWTGTQAEYDALSSYDSTKLYFIT